MSITRTLSCLLASVALANLLHAEVYTNGPARVVASAWYCAAHHIAAGGSLELHLDAGCTLGGGWHKNSITVADGGTFTLTAADGAKLETYEAKVLPGGTYIDTIARRRGYANRGRDSYHLTVQGTARFPGGLTYIFDQWGLSQPLIEILPGGAVHLGGDVNDNGHAASTWLLKGGMLILESDSTFDVASLKFAPATTSTVHVARGKTADLRAAKPAPNATIVKEGDGLLRLPADATNLTVKAGIVELCDEKGPVKRLLSDGKIQPVPAPKPTFATSDKPVNGVWTIWSGAVRPGTPIEVDLPVACNPSEAERGECLISLKTHGSLAPCRLSTYSNLCYLADGPVRYYVKKNHKKDSSLSAQPGAAFTLAFEVPKEAANRPMRLHLPGISGTALPLAVAVQKGLSNVKFDLYTDYVNRCYHIDASPMRKFVKRITYTYPDLDEPTGQSTVTTDKLRLRRRYPEGAKEPFQVKADIETFDYGTVHTSFTVTPVKPPRLFKQPAPNNEVIVGICAYEQKNLRPELVTNDLCNLYVIYSNWGHGLLKKAFGPEIAAQAEKQGLYTMTIYGGAPKGLVNEVHRDWGERYLENNIGEYCGFLYQGPREGAHVPRLKSTVAARDSMVDNWIFDRMFRGWGRYGYNHVYSTSGSPLANYELQGGLEVICNELYALGSGNLAYATAEARGAARKWKPEYWSGWNAHEWQVKGIPYGVDQKYDLLYAGFLLQYAMGTSLIVLESGAESTQAFKYTAWDKGQTNVVWQGYFDPAPRRYRATVKKFWEFVKANPRAEGTPDTSIALVLGNTDAFVGMVSGGFAQWGNHKEAVSNSLWRCGAPEYTWTALQYGFFPCGQAALKPYGNGWLAGSPYGQIDVVCVDDEARLSDVSRYRLLVCAGWNVMSRAGLRTYQRFVSEKGGTLLIGTPHFSTREDREYRHYLPSDLVQPALAGVEVLDCQTVTGRVEVASLMPRDLTEKLGKLPEFKKGLRLAKLRLKPGAEVLATVGGEPLIVRSPCGKGWVWFFAAWDYPGASRELSQVYVRLAQGLARQVPQRVTIESAAEKGDDAIYCTYAVYGKVAYFVNVDCVHPRAVRIRFADGSTRELQMPPCSLTTVELPAGIRRN
ncbi:MAG: hypothetical protein ACI4X9_05745 [Kiritimatiellia bacterium]